MRLKIEILLDRYPDDQGARQELARILRETAEQITEPRSVVALRDDAGERVGFAEVTV